MPLTRPWCEKKKQEHLFLQHCGAPLAVEGEQVVARARAPSLALSAGSLTPRGDEAEAPFASPLKVVVLSKVLAHEVNFGFHNMGCMVLASFNGDDDAARSLGALASAIARSDAPVLEFALQRNLTDSRGHELICLDAAECARSEREILGQHMIASPHSPDCSSNA